MSDKSGKDPTVLKPEDDDDAAGDQEIVVVDVDLDLDVEEPSIVILEHQQEGSSSKPLLTGPVSPSSIISAAMIQIQMTPTFEAIERVESGESQPGAFAIPGVELRRQHHISSEMPRLSATEQEVLVHATVVCDDVDDNAVDDEQPSIVFEALPLNLRQRAGNWKWILAVSCLVLMLTFAVAMVFIQNSNNRESPGGGSSGTSDGNFVDKGFPIEIVPSAYPSSTPTRAPKTWFPTAAPSIRKSMNPSGSINPSQSPTETPTATPSLLPTSSSYPSSIPSTGPSETPSTPPSIYIPEWEKVGPSIVGEHGGDYLGQSMALSRYGNILVVGSHLYDFDAQLDSGMVRVYERKTNGNEADVSWQQLGQDFVGSNTADQAGWAVDVSADGSIVAIASFTGGVNLEGSVHIYEYNRSFDFWAPLGQSLYGNEDAVFFGGSMALSDDGLTLVVGADRDDSGGENAGRVQIFKFNRIINVWIQLGQTFYGGDAQDQAGSVVSLSGTGDVVAMGVPDKDVVDATDAGLVRVYKLHSTGLAWTALGSSLTGTESEERFGMSVDLSEDGMILAVSSRSRVHVYNFDVETNDWSESESEPMLEDVDVFELSNRNTFVDISPDGTTMIVSTSSDSSPGMVQAYELDAAKEWVPVLKPIYNGINDGSIAPSIHLTDDRQLAVGFPKHSSHGLLNLGKVEVYQFPTEI
jgi:hypothetical protein